MSPNRRNFIKQSAATLALTALPIKALSAPHTVTKGLPLEEELTNIDIRQMLGRTHPPDSNTPILAHSPDDLIDFFRHPDKYPNMDRIRAFNELLQIKEYLTREDIDNLLQNLWFAKEHDMEFKLLCKVGEKSSINQLILVIKYSKFKRTLDLTHSILNSRIMEINLLGLFNQVNQAYIYRFNCYWPNYKPKFYYKSYNKNLPIKFTEKEKNMIMNAWYYEYNKNPETAKNMFTNMFTEKRKPLALARG